MTSIICLMPSKPTVCPSVASRNLLLYQSLPISIPYRYALLRRRKDDTDMGTASRGIVEWLHRFPRRVRIHLRLSRCESKEAPCCLSTVGFTPALIRTGQAVG